jgi:L-ascorbate metabolism protein UlaG (beta-lactamase superfamily)
MKITKLGHCCLFIEAQGLRILTDPGNYSEGQDKITGINIVLITHHEHRDHLNMESLKTVLRNNPSAKIMTNASVGRVLAREQIPYTVLEDGQNSLENGVLIEAVGKTHAVIYPTLPDIHNTGYFIANQLFYPGDALTNPKKRVDILAYPATAVWVKLSEAIDYVKEIRPKICFPVHDGNMISAGSVHSVPPGILEPLGIRFTLPVPEREMNF